MLVRTRFALAALFLAACAPSTRTATPGPVPAPPAPPPQQQTTTPPPPPPSAAPAEPVLREAPEDWQLLDATSDGYIGTGVERAYSELLAGRQPARTVVVAVIDGGVDTAHVDLKANLWKNEDEVPGNGVDDDRNGYIDDVYGWNFLGNSSGDDVQWDTFEVTRLHVACANGGPPAGIDATCDEIEQDYQQKRNEAQQVLGQVRQIRANLDIALPMLRGALGGDSLTLANVQALRSEQPNVRQAREFYLALAGAGISPADVEDAAREYQAQLDYNLNPDFDPRSTVADDFSDATQRTYGNPDVTGPDAKHGTHVAGIIGAGRGNGVGMDGITSAVKIMAVRAVPDGDERDKDVANAIRYAVDNGAQVINMSFGKAYSPRKGVVDDAVKYADEHGVLIIHAAGNDGEDLEVESNFPNREYEGGGTAANWIEVGASAWQGADSLAAPFSNYGKTRVDVFAPGVDILSTVPGDEFSRQDGTSMAAPVVTGVAALLMAYFPDLAASDVKRILMESATSYGDRSVVRPGGQDQVPFGQLSVTGGVVNAYEAIRRAQRAVSND